MLPYHRNIKRIIPLLPLPHVEVRILIRRYVVGVYSVDILKQRLVGIFIYYSLNLINR